MQYPVEITGGQIFGEGQECADTRRAETLRRSALSATRSQYYRQARSVLIYATVRALSNGDELRSNIRTITVNLSFNSKEETSV